MLSTIFDQLIPKLKNKLAERAKSAVNAQTLEGLSPDEIRTGVTKAQLGLSDVENYPIATSVEVNENDRDDRYLVPQTMIQYVSDHIPYQEGGVLSVEIEGQQPYLKGVAPLVTVSLVKTDTDLQLAQNDTSTPIIDIRYWETYTWDGSQWVKGGSVDYRQIVRVGQFIFSPVTNSLHVLVADKKLTNLQ
jgi:hypothetical protein